MAFRILSLIKKKNNNNSDKLSHSCNSNAWNTSDDVKEKDSIIKTQVYEKPLVYLINFDNSLKQKLTEAKFSCDSGALGPILKFSTDKKVEKFYVMPKPDIKDNLHEYDIVLFDLTEKHYELYDRNKHFYQRKDSSTQYAFYCETPQFMVDLQPYEAQVVANQMRDLLKKRSIIICFYSDYREANYNLIKIINNGYVANGNVEFNNIIFSHSKFVVAEDKIGEKVKVSDELPYVQLKELLKKYENKMTYRSFFKIIKERSRDLQEFVIHPSFLPLVYNEAQQIVSYCHFNEEAIILVFPEVEDKLTFAYELLTNVLPEMTPNLFPYHGQFNWLNNNDYLLPNEYHLKEEMQEIQKEFEIKITDIKSRLDQNRTKYKFLHDLLSETGDTLVTAVKMYLEWLGFQSVINMDDHAEEIFEEDLQVNDSQGLLVIEIKGIGGTSKDNECSQISKIRYRRMKEKQRFDVFGLYIVNHQRYMPPKTRINPPFTENQMEDAISDDRGLLTTYELFKSYYLIDQGLITKDEVRARLFYKGLITLFPNFLSLGKPIEIYKNGKIVIVKLEDGVKLCVGDNIYIKDNEISPIKIESIQFNDNDVNSIIGSNQEIGISLSKKVTINSELLIKK